MRQKGLEIKEQYLKVNKDTGLTDAEVNAINTVFKRHPKIGSAVLFGSRAKGNYKNGSDIDIALKGKGLLLMDILDISIDLEDLMFPYKFDIVAYDRIDEKDLIEHIDRVGIRFYKRTA
ncbi:putative nucleotidyltransferase [Echinicola vietnamensis DSM 17526]|uniref:Putative nucleotidyltransferase n=1 Tax=Echinicola vietnamensis (strain DSM 17526 / LMG 23754 / KMM 6221) TaxID=926556 RepID=L0G6F9_ECHVK|nr:putative nucleotidyltransferase [Echinicola vietnamensis DSM 17526]